MKVSEFIESYNKVQNAASKDAILKKLNVKDYVGFIEKSDFIKRVVDAANSEFDEENNFVRVKLNSINQHMLFTMGLIQLYTDLEIDFSSKNFIEYYDLLRKNGLVEKIFELIGEKEVTECVTFLEMYKDDFIQNNFSMQSFVVNQIDRINDIVNTITSPTFMNFIEDEFGKGEKQK